MSKYLTTKPGSLESAVLEAVSPAQQAAIAIAKKEKGEKPKNEEKVECPKCKGEGCDHCDGKGYHMAEGKLEEKPADLLVLQFRSSSDAARAYKVLTQKVAGNMVPYEDAYDEGDELVIEFPDDADKLMKDMKSKGAPSFKVLEREEYSDFSKKKTEELTAKQKKIDLNKDGKIGADDLKKLRAGAKTEEVKEEISLAQRAAEHITNMWKESAKMKKEEEEPKEKEDKKTMTGKPVSKVEVTPEDPEGK